MRKFLFICHMNFPSYSTYAKHWQLNPEIVFLNHGSFGACPIKVLEKQNTYRTQMESDPVRFMVEDLEELAWQSKETLARFTGCKAKDLVFVPNATTGVNLVLKNLSLNPGDEILTHNHNYSACNNALLAFAQKWKANVITASVPFPLKTEDEIIDAFVKAITPKTRLALIDHVTSATGIIFPVKKLTKILQEKGIVVIIDGAHAPGMLDLDIDNIGAEFYTGNCHKWICSPKGSALLHVREDRQKNFLPLTTGHSYDRPLEERKWSGQFFWPGTNDYSASICVADAIEYMGSMLQDWPTLRKHNHDLLIQGRNKILQALNAEAPAPDELLGSLSTIPLPIPYERPEYFFNHTHPFGRMLYNKYKIQIPIHAWPHSNPRIWIRISAQAYNSLEQYEYLGEVLREVGS